MSLSTKRIAKKIVARSRLRSTIEPPPKELPPAADAEGTGEAGVFARVKKDEEDEDAGDDRLQNSENDEHGAKV